ncbi:Non-canonical poly(A) RNA polymerase PAPD5 [Elsinoe australis]|uniref:Non-canonical poly(A) RNA polymerase PAPD5 n=1 Tax=Elsinoe australis TaxID=40998 RepID=A0A2P7YC48_9PEZI|nr:Non-canonical poly(A) RNA polymerase PAPD5 [Elsinoe australis]
MAKAQITTQGQHLPIEARTRDLVFVIDAIDECDESDQLTFINLIADLRLSLPDDRETFAKKFLITSRPYIQTQDPFRVAIEQFSIIHVKGEDEHDQIRKEIDVVIRYCVDQLANTLEMNPLVASRLLSKMLGMQNRTYLWLHLVLNDIRTTLRINLRSDQENLLRIPRSVDEAYEKILSRSTEPEKAKIVLQIVVGARRPLLVREMVTALSEAIDKHRQSAAGIILVSATLPDAIRSCYGLFVFFNQSRAYLIHQTAKEFLYRTSVVTPDRFNWALDPPEAQRLLATICIKYLSMVDVAPWYNVDATVRAEWISNTAITEAVKGGHLITIDPLIKHGANVNLSGCETCLQCAVERRDEVIVRLLVQGGAEINLTGGLYGSALIAAIVLKEEKMIRLLLDEGADMYANVKPYKNALSAAITRSRGRERLLRLLVEYGADLNFIHDDGTLLQKAALQGDDMLGQILLEQGADVNARSGIYGTALHAPMRFPDRESFVQLLLEFGAPILFTSACMPIRILELMHRTREQLNKSSGYP